MFTGLVAGQGTITDIKRSKNGSRLLVNHHGLGKKIKIGDSVSINGCCLTAVSNSRGVLTFDLLQETLKLTTFKSIKIGEKVNMETALKFGDKIGGHMVTGHVDGVGVISGAQRKGSDVYFEITPPKPLLKWIRLKGSVAIDGVSLTIAKASKNKFIVCLIPHTLKLTTLGWKREGDHVNLEGDLLAKYARN
jgi:riboflavin synthase alpha subunit